MAEAVLSSVVEGIVTKLGSLLLEEIGLLWGVKDEFRKFNDIVLAIKAVLYEAEEQYVASHQVREWLGQLKEAIYDAENLLDDLSTEALRQKAMPGRKVSKEVRLFFSRSNQLVYGLNMAHRIRNMSTRLKNIVDNKEFHLVAHPMEKPIIPKNRLQTHSHRPSVVVGREGDKKKIVDLLLSTNYEENVGIVTIVGIGGLGKTTLAQLVFNDERVISQFELKLWACVADDFDVKLITSKIICSATKEIVGDIEMDILVDRLHEKINGKKYLLVLDDMWNEDPENWFMLKDLLLGGAKGSKILVTTRLNNVAKMTQPIGEHVLQGLSKDESWSLFAQMAFKRGEDPRQSKKEIGEKIVTKCSGVPLAIKAVGGLLYSKTTVSEWSSFASKELLTINSNISSILKLSYDHLPSHLKYCFAYCCLFPKDHIIQVPKLINLWMAQGYVSCSSPNECLEDAGLEYFMDLLWRSFFQEVENDYLGNIKSCKMHDLMHDLASKVAGSESKIFESKEKSIGKETRHLSFHFDQTSPWNLPLSLTDANDVRTFLLLHNPWGGFELDIKMDEKEWNVFTCRLRNLRSLDLHSSAIIKVPHSISKLKHLRYLDLSFNYSIKILPHSITKLSNLQVLRLECCFSLIQLPKNIHHLINLSQLDLTGCSALEYMPRGLGHLTTLHTLTSFVVPTVGSMSKHAGTLVELQNMNKLRGELEIFDLDYATSNLRGANLKEKQHLKSLTLHWRRVRQNEMDEDEITMALEALEPHRNLKVLQVTRYIGLKLPKWISSLTNLVKIMLLDCTSCWYIPPLHHLPYLRELYIFGLCARVYGHRRINTGNVIFLPFPKDITTRILL